MIVSHKHKFIFIKNQKTAGTAVEIALSQFCGPDDIITPIFSRDESTRNKLGYPGPQNYYVPLSKYFPSDIWRLVRYRRRKHYRTHAWATEIQSYLDSEVWETYFKFCFERNPWDRVVSGYYWKYRTEDRPPISDYVQSGQMNELKGYDLYTEKSEIVVDRVFRYEDMPNALREIGKILDLPKPIILPVANSGFRPKECHYRDILSDADRKKNRHYVCA